MLIYLKLFLTAVCWGGTFIAGRMLAGHVPPFCAAFLRFAIASVFLMALACRAWGGLPRLKRRQVLPVALLAMTGVFAYNAFFFKGLEYIPAGRAALIIALNPIAISLLSAAIFGERFTWVKALGVLLSVSGAVVVITDGHPEMLWRGGVGRGELLILGCVASWVSYSLIGKSVMGGMTPLAAVCYATLLGAAALLFPALGEGLLGGLPHYGAREWGSLFYLGFFGTVLGFLWYYDGIREIGPARASVFINFVPVSAVAMGYVILGETVSPALFAGAALVIGGVCTTNAAALRPRPATAGLGKELP